MSPDLLRQMAESLRFNYAVVALVKDVSGKPVLDVALLSPQFAAPRRLGFRLPAAAMNPTQCADTNPLPFHTNDAVACRPSCQAWTTTRGAPCGCASTLTFSNAPSETTAVRDQRIRLAQDYSDVDVLVLPFLIDEQEIVRFSRAAHVGIAQ